MATTRLLPELLVGNGVRLHALFSVLIPLFFLGLFAWRKSSTRRGLPPGPPRLPIIGNLHQLLGDLPHRSLRRLSDRYGPLMHVQFGAAPSLVVSSAEMAQQVLRTQDRMFCGRPALVSAEKFSYGGLDMGAAPYSHGLKQTRNLSKSQLLSAKKLELSRPMREEEVGILVSAIARLSSSSSSSSRPVNLSDMLLCLFSNIIGRQVSGRRLCADGECMLTPLNQTLSEINSLLGGFSAGDLFPNMAWMDVLTGRRARIEKSFRDIDKFLDDEIDMHATEASIDGRACRISKVEDENFITTLLRLREDPDLNHLLTRDKIKAILMDMFIGGSQNSTSSLEWAMSELVMNPKVMKKAQEEVRAVVGAKEKVDEDDLKQLQYIKLVLKETWRLHPPGPLLLPRQCREDCDVGGYAVSVNTWVVVNVWAIGRDPKYWREPEVFRPERFEDRNVDYKGQHFVLLPFGSGRRMCPGMALGVAGVELTLANLLHKFNWALSDAKEKHGVLDMKEAMGISCHRRSPLLLNATLASNGAPS